MPHRAPSPALSEQGWDISNTLVPDDDGAEIGGFGDLNSGLFDQDSKEARKNGFAEGSSDEDDETFIAAQQAASHRKAGSLLKGNAAKKSGGFQSMGLNATLIKAISRKGFSVPTPIQRKAIPLILDNQDVVGMARTGSGKTAAFVIPMLEKLKAHSVRVGARAIILSPSRELALQTLKATKEFGRGTDLRTILLVGGDSLEDQFSQMASNPDIIIATPGRFLHLLVEMSLDLSSVRYLVFDEADRLFEMGFAVQLTEILHAIPPSRQTLLFSATLPKSLVEFAKAGLREPNLVRLDAESKISPDLESAFLMLKSADKEAALLHILNDVIKMPQVQSSGKSSKEADKMTSKKRKREVTKKSSTESPTEHSTIVFAATKHHVEYLTTLLKSSGFGVSYVYGTLDQSARQSQVDSFRSGETTILVVTDVAARGIDIPMLANVINYDFPSQPKIFVHRVGRTARAGRKGWSYSLIQTSDVPYLLDLQLFLGRNLVCGRNGGLGADFSQHIVVGAVPRSALDKNAEMSMKILNDDEDIAALRSVAVKGEKLYTRTRNSASAESAKRAKEFTSKQALQEACLLYEEDSLEKAQSERDSMLARISGFRPAETVFEIGKRGDSAKTEAAKAAESMRKQREKTRVRNQLQAAVDGAGTDDVPEMEETQDGESGSRLDAYGRLEAAEDLGDGSEDELEITVSESKPRSLGSRLESWQDAEHFMSYEPTYANQAEERGYGVHSGSNQSGRGSSFANAAREEMVDMNNDESKSFAAASKVNQLRWDKRGKKYVSTANDTDGSKGARTIRGESGQKIAASFRSGRFDAWRRTNKLDRLPRTGEKESTQHSRGITASGKRFKHHAERAPKQPDKHRDDYYKKKKKLEERKASDATKGRSEVRDTEDIRKQRKLKERRRDKNARPARKRA